MIDSIYQARNKQPEPITKDSRGTPIVEGAKVAYNLSGAVALGKIVKVRKNIWTQWQGRWHDDTPEDIKVHWSLDFSMSVENENGKISTLKNANSFVIIE